MRGGGGSTRNSTREGYEGRRECEVWVGESRPVDYVDAICYIISG